MTASKTAPLKVAIVSTGLGHVARGIETWALALAEALTGDGVRQVGFEATLFHAAQPTQAIPVTSAVGLRCFKRGTRLNRWVTRLGVRLGGWRYGFGSPYETEQSTFAPGLIRALRTGGYHLVHLQDPWLAWLLEKARRRHHHDAQVILAHGTEESMSFLRRFSFLQELSDAYARRWDSVAERPKPRVWTIPNFVDAQRFSPSGPSAAPDGARRLRRKLGIPDEAHLIGSASAINRGRKRVDYLCREFGAWVKRQPAPWHLVIAGAGTPETEAIRREADALAPGRVHWLVNYPYAEMPDFYRMLDGFALCAQEEIFGIVWLEALATGVPCLGHQTPVTAWILGEGGRVGDLSQPGGLGELLDAWVREQSAEDGEQRSENRRQKTGGPEPVGGSGEFGGRGCGEPREGVEVGEQIAAGGLPCEVLGRSRERSSHIGEERLSCSDDRGEKENDQHNNAQRTTLSPTLSAKARERAVRIFSTEAVIPQILEMYREVVRSSRAL